MANRLSIQCPSCKRHFELTARGKLPPQVRLRCAACRTIFVLRRRGAPAPTSPAKPPEEPRAGSAPAPAPRNGVTVLVANESLDYCAVVRAVIEGQTDYAVEEVHDGETAWQQLLKLRPQMFVTDVALSGLYGFEAAERIRNEPTLSKTKLILIASVYDKTRYKRNPTQLYGADDYVEQHHIPDMLVPKINNLLLGVRASGAPPGAPPEPTNGETRAIEVPSIDPAQEAALRSAEPTLGAGDGAGGRLEEKARRLARIIVSDIALYSEELLTRGIREGNAEKLLAGEFDEARELYAQRVPAEIRSRRDFLGEEIERLLASTKAQFAEPECD